MTRTRKRVFSLNEANHLLTGTSIANRFQMDRE